MKRLFFLFIYLIFLSGFSPVKLYAQIPYDQQWPGFRGPWGRGFVENEKTETT
jgi:hypothetical protein